MLWFKKFTKKSRKPSKHPTSVGTPSHVRSIPPGLSVEPDADARSGGTLILETDELYLTTLVGRKDGHDSRIVPPSSGHRRFNTSDVPASIPRHSDATRGCALLQMMRSM